MLVFTIHTLLRALIAASLLASVLSPITPVTAYQSQGVEYAERLDEYLHTRMEEYKIPGLAAAIVRNGQVEFQKGYGTANPNGGRVTPETNFLLASVSKSFTALGIMQLVEAGKLHLDDPLQKHLPWFDVAGEGGEAITVAHLIYHTSGFSNYDGNEISLLPSSPDGLETGVRELKRVSLRFPPGEDWQYSNLNYNVLGLLIQTVSGQRYEDYIEENIFTPLGMSGSQTSLASARLENAARGYYPLFGMPQAVDIHMPEAGVPSAGLWSSAADMSRYLLAHLAGGSDLGLTPEGLAQLHAPGYEIAPGFNYAMGWYHAPYLLDLDFLQNLGTGLDPAADLQALWHEGDWKGYKSIALLLPGQEYGVILLMNTNDPTVTSVFRDFAWDVTLIANGGNAFYFQPGESFVVRHARWLFSGLALILLGGLVWSLTRLKRAGGKSRTLFHGLIAVLNLGLLAYLYLNLLPANDASLRALLNRAPDLGFLVILVTGVAALWIPVSILNLLKSRAKT